MRHPVSIWCVYFRIDMSIYWLTFGCMLIVLLTGEDAAAEEEVNPSSARQNTTDVHEHEGEGSTSEWSPLHPICVDQHIDKELFFQLYIIYIQKVWLVHRRIVFHMQLLMLATFFVKSVWLFLHIFPYVSWIKLHIFNFDTFPKFLRNMQSRKK